MKESGDIPVAKKQWKNFFLVKDSVSEGKQIIVDRSVCHITVQSFFIPSQSKVSFTRVVTVLCTFSNGSNANPWCLHITFKKIKGTADKNDFLIC